MSAAQFSVGGGGARPRGRRASQGNASRGRISPDGLLDPQSHAGGARSSADGNEAAGNRRGGRRHLDRINKMNEMIRDGSDSVNFVQSVGQLARAVTFATSSSPEAFNFQI